MTIFSSRDGKPWEPTYITAIDGAKCIGCGRCYKVCAHGVLGPKELDEEDTAKLFMKIEHPGNCIGCQACGRTCTKKAFSFEPVPV